MMQRPALHVDVTVARGDTRIAADFDVAPGIARRHRAERRRQVERARRDRGARSARVGAGVDRRASGDGLPPERRRIGVVFQDYVLFPHLTVRDNVAFAARMHGSRASAARPPSRGSTASA